MHDPNNPFAQNPAAGYQGSSRRPNTSGRGGSKALLWIFAIFGGICLVCCGGGVIFLGYVGVAGPETSVYSGNQVPQRFLNTAREVGALEPGENVRFFYSDALVDIREGFYFVSDRKVVVYTEDGRAEPMIAIEFDEMANVELLRNESFLEDSQITIETKDGDFFAFPVSSEFDRDEKFFEAIRKEVPAGESLPHQMK